MYTYKYYSQKVKATGQFDWPIHYVSWVQLVLFKNKCCLYVVDGLKFFFNIICLYVRLGETWLDFSGWMHVLSTYSSRSFLFRTVFVIFDQSIWWVLIRIATILTHCSLETPKKVFGKQCRPRSEAAEHGVWSGSPLFANSATIFLWEYLTLTIGHT